MAMLKCKMCGGDLELRDDKGYGTCQHCGSTMTLPKTSDERKANLFNRANQFRMANEFDKAILAYESILNDDNSDAEAHWGIVLSKYGIEYVEDPRTHERVPTCHRVHSESVLGDADYLAAIENSPDEYTKNLYEEEAKKISEIQNGILAISRQEEPFDVFICYKETSDNGARTTDSVLAQDIYYQLKQEGYKVFYAKITLEDKLGQQYEPYIFAALNSAKVMVVVGTNPEHFNAVWVKNEWSRFLAVIKKDRNRLLIPCYKDMGAYSLPQEMSSLQSQDMSKIGFIQDLVRGIKKVLDAEKPNTEATQAMPILERAFLCLEDGDFGKADELLEQTLNQDPKNAHAYISKLMVKLKVRNEGDLQNVSAPISSHGDYEKAVRFADDEYKAKIQGYNGKILERIDKKRKEEEALAEQKSIEAEKARFQAERLRLHEIAQQKIRTKRNKMIVMSLVAATALIIGVFMFSNAMERERHFGFIEQSKSATPQSATAAIKAGADVNVQNESGQTALMLAAGHNTNPEVIKILLASGADPNLRDSKNKRALDYANNDNANVLIALDNSEFLELCKTASSQRITDVINAGADVNVKREDGLTPLMMAAGYNQDMEAVSALIRRGLSVNARDKTGSTVIMFAARHNSNPEIIGILFKAGANLNAKNSDGRTALDYARSNKSFQGTEAYKMLEDASK